MENSKLRCRFHHDDYDDSFVLDERDIYSKCTWCEKTLCFNCRRDYGYDTLICGNCNSEYCCMNCLKRCNCRIQCYGCVKYVQYTKNTHTCEKVGCTVTLCNACYNMKNSKQLFTNSCCGIQYCKNCECGCREISIPNEEQ